MAKFSGDFHNAVQNNKNAETGCIELPGLFSMTVRSLNQSCVMPLTPAGDLRSKFRVLRQVEEFSNQINTINKLW